MGYSVPLTPTAPTAIAFTFYRLDLYAFIKRKAKTLTRLHMFDIMSCDMQNNGLCTLKCLSIGTSNTTTYPLSQMENDSYQVFQYLSTLQFQILGHLKIIYFPFGTNGKFVMFKCPNT